MCSPILRMWPCARNLKPPEEYFLPSVLIPKPLNKQILNPKCWSCPSALHLKGPTRMIPSIIPVATGGGIIRRGCFSCQCRPVQQEGWPMVLSLPLPGALTAALALALLLSLPSSWASWGWRKPAGAGQHKYMLQLTALSVGAVGMEAAAHGKVPGMDRNSLEEKREKEAPSSSHRPSCIRPLPPHFLT